MTYHENKLNCVEQWIKATLNKIVDFNKNLNDCMCCHFLIVFYF